MATVTINIAAYVAPLSITLDSFTGGCFGFTTSGPAQSTLIMQISTDNGLTWINNSGPATSPRCGFAEPTVTSKYRIASVTDPVVYSNIIERVIASTAPVTEAALRSAQGYATTTETNVCLASLVTDCRVATQIANKITSGDVMYEADGVTRFNGFNGYYNVVISISQATESSKVCLIGTDGTMHVDTICTSF
jgi:hypothetical protein